MRKEYAEYLTKETIQNYNLIASDYTRTRSYIPEDIRALGDYTANGERILDSGCASGHFFEVLKNKKVDYFGIDISEKLIEIARRNYPEASFETVNALKLPFPDNFFDEVYSISVIHNIPSTEFRFQYLKEVIRVLKPNGRLILRVWNFWKRKAGLKLILRYAFLKIIGKSKLDFKDVFVPWKDSQGRILIQRYFHCFTKREFEGLARKAGFKIEKSWRAGKGKRANIYLIAQKP